MRKFKRIFGFCLLLFCCLCIMSCGKEKEIELAKLTCYKSIASNNGIDTKLVTTVGYDGDEVKTYMLKWLIKYDESKFNEKDILDLVEDTTENYKTNYGGSSHVKISNTKITAGEYGVIVDINYGKMPKKEREQYGFNFTDDYTKTKNSFVNAGYICD